MGMSTPKSETPKPIRSGRLYEAVVRLSTNTLGLRGALWSYKADEMLNPLRFRGQIQAIRKDLDRVEKLVAGPAIIPIAAPQAGKTRQSLVKLIAAERLDVTVYPKDSMIKLMSKIRNAQARVAVR